MVNTLIYYSDETTLKEVIDGLDPFRTEAISSSSKNFAHILYKYKKYSEAYKKVLDIQPDIQIPQCYVAIDMSGCNSFSGNEMNKLDMLWAIPTYAAGGGVTYVLYCDKNFPRVWEEG